MNISNFIVLHVAEQLVTQYMYMYMTRDLLTKCLVNVAYYNVFPPVCHFFL